MMSGVSAAAGSTSGPTACALATAGGASAATTRSLLVATAFLAGTLRFFVFAAFLPAAFSFPVLAAFLSADFNSRVRIAFFFAALRFVGMGIPLVKGVIWRRSYNAYLRGVQVVRLWRRQRDRSCNAEGFTCRGTGAESHKCSSFCGPSNGGNNSFDAATDWSILWRPQHFQMF
jgi:hypothetical protein